MLSAPEFIRAQLKRLHAGLDKSLTDLTPEQLRFLLGAAYSRFYVRPSYAAHCFRVVKSRPGRIARRLDQAVSAYQSRGETALMSRAV